MNAALLAARRRAVPRPNLLPARAHNFDWYSEGLPGNLRTYNNLAPDGSLSAVKLTESAAQAPHYVFNTDVNNLPKGTPCTFSVYLKAAGRSWAQVNLQYYSTPHFIQLNLLTGEVWLPTDRNVQPRSYRTQRLEDGWWRISIVDNNQVNTTVNGAIHILDDNRQSVYTGDGVSGVLVWHPMLNIGSVPSPFTTQTQGA